MIFLFTSFCFCFIHILTKEGEKEYAYWEKLKQDLRKSSHGEDLTKPPQGDLGKDLSESNKRKETCGSDVPPRKRRRKEKKQPEHVIFEDSEDDPSS